MANPYELQKCACGHAWDSHEGSGGPCAFQEPPTQEEITKAAEEQREPEHGPRCECAAWDGQPPADADEDDDDEPDQGAGDQGEQGQGDAGGGDDDELP